MISSPSSLMRALRKHVDGRVLFDEGARAAYSTDASNYRRVPVGVVIPRHEEDVRHAVELAREFGCPITSRGGGTSLGGQACNAGLILDFSRYMNRVIGIDSDRNIAEVQPGVVQSHLDSALARFGKFFAPDPSTRDRCTIGGMIGNNSCGPHSAAYGKTADNVEALRIRLYDGTAMSLNGRMEAGEIEEASSRGGREGAIYSALTQLRDRSASLVRKHFPKIPRRVSGYNLDQLLPENGFNLARAFVGSEGTLGIVTSARIRIVARPAFSALAVIGFDDVFAAGDAVQSILAHRPAALEGFDSRLPEFAHKRGNAAVRLLPHGGAFLIAETTGSTADDARDRAEALISTARAQAGFTASACLTNPHEREGVWKLRESGLGSGAYIAGRPRMWPGAEDCAVAPERIGEFLRRYDRLLSSNGLEAAMYYGHFGEGCVHARINFDFASVGGVKVFRSAMEQIGALVAEFGGSLSGEHGDGYARSELLPMIYPPELMSAFAEFKRIFDPESKMNPGVIVAPERLDAHLKISPQKPVANPKTNFNFDSEGGLSGALLKCVGIGKCRKTDTATMCPSYMATRSERHSTRGRARILYEALTDGVVSDGFDSPALHHALETCLSCKACKTECPSSIDMAAYRAEFYSNWFTKHRRPLGSRVFGNLHAIARAGSVAPRAVNFMLGNRLIGRATREILDIHRSRELPRLARKTFRSWYRRAPHPAASREIILFPDTFTNYFEPEVAIAATRVLERAGYRVTLPASDICCGRPLFEQGMLDRARRNFETVIAKLGDAARRGTPIIGLEPSCILTFRDEMPAFFPKDATVDAIKNQTMLLGEFLAQNPLDAAFAKIDSDLIVQAHCHQNALASTAGDVDLLSRASPGRVRVLDAGCCGMAGAFGYSERTYRISRGVAMDRLIPAIHAADPESIVVADGFSCRTQIRHFSRRPRTMHLAQVLEMAMDAHDADPEIRS